MERISISTEIQMIRQTETHFSANLYTLIRILALTFQTH
jgi:hypothetical protein